MATLPLVDAFYEGCSCILRGQEPNQRHIMSRCFGVHLSTKNKSASQLLWSPDWLPIDSNWRVTEVSWQSAGGQPTAVET